MIAAFSAPRKIAFGKNGVCFSRNALAMREFEYKIDPFFVSVRFFRGSIEQSIDTGESQVENGEEIVFEHDFELDVLVVFSVKSFEQSSRVRSCGKEWQLIPMV